MNIPRVGIGVLIFKDNYLLLGQRKNSHGAETWAPPGGHLEFGESFEDCAIREVQEETGLVISEPQFIGVTNDIFQDENKHYISLFLSARFPENQEIQNREPHKVLSWEWLALNRLPTKLFLPLKNFLEQKEDAHKGCPYNIFI